MGKWDILGVVGSRRIHVLVHCRDLACSMEIIVMIESELAPKCSSLQSSQNDGYPGFLLTENLPRNTRTWSGATL